MHLCRSDLCLVFSGFNLDSLQKFTSKNFNLLYIMNTNLNRQYIGICSNIFCIYL